MFLNERIEVIKIMKVARLMLLFRKKKKQVHSKSQTVKEAFINVDGIKRPIPE